ncbi:MAG: hypothetical protein KatS3mg111_0966 [Pirellulaceae bacterium]|nr:MAG: hypothetical protein KatS3mg111_0966 [Pirellulaceae bacterium]
MLDTKKNADTEPHTTPRSAITTAHPTDHLNRAVEQQWDRLAELLTLDDALSPAADDPGELRNDLTTEQDSNRCVAIDLSIVLLCGNDADTIGNCILKAFYALRRCAIRGEVIVVDCRSRDDSIEIAEELGARIVHADSDDPADGVRAALAVTRGEAIVFGPADDTFDYSRVHHLFNKLQSGYDAVQGCRLPVGGGRIRPGGMSWARRQGHQLIGNLLHRWWGLPVHDPFCPVWAVRRRIVSDGTVDRQLHAEALARSCAMFLHSRGATVAEVPITWETPHGPTRRYAAARTNHYRELLQALGTYLLMMPERTLLLPAALLLVASILSLAVAYCLPAGAVGASHVPLLFSLIGVASSVQLAGTGLLIRLTAADRGVIPRCPRMERAAEILSWNRTLQAALMAVLAGAWTCWQWNFEVGGPMASPAMPGVTLSSLLGWGMVLVGVQVASLSCLIRIMRWNTPTTKKNKSARKALKRSTPVHQSF